MALNTKKNIFLLKKSTLAQESKFKIKAEEIFKDSFPKIITVARLEKRKSHDKILMTVKNLKVKFPNISHPLAYLIILLIIKKIIPHSIKSIYIGNMSLLIKFLQSLNPEKKYWIYSILFIIALFIVLTFFIQGTEITEWIYTVF